MTRTTPPFGADHVGSLLRPAALKEARARRERGEITGAEPGSAEDEAVKYVIGKQAETGLRGATDGEFRRAMWHFGFPGQPDGVESFVAEHGIAFKGGIETHPTGLRVTGKPGYSAHPMVQHFRFLCDHARPVDAPPGAPGAVPKMTSPAPSVLHLRGGRHAVSRDVYPDMEEFCHDRALAYRAAVQCGFASTEEGNVLTAEEQWAKLRRIVEVAAKVWGE